MIKKILINLTVILFTIFIFDFIIGSTLRYFYFKESSGLHYLTTNSIDKIESEIIVIGSSRATHHYVPEVFENLLKTDFWNAGRDGHNIFYQLAIMKAILKRYTPKIIIVDLDISFKKESFERLNSLLPYYKKHEEIRDIIKLRGPYEKIKLLSQIYPFNSIILTIIIGNLKINKIRKPNNKGYIAERRGWNDDIERKNSKIYTPDSQKIETLKEMIKLSKNSGAKLIAVYSPLFTIENTNPGIDICKKLCLSENVPLYNFINDTLFINNKTLFHNKLHLNHYGASIFSQIIANRIKQNY